MGKKHKELECSHCSLAGTKAQLAKHYKAEPCGQHFDVDSTPREFRAVIEVEKPTAKQIKARVKAMVWFTKDMRIAIELRRNVNSVSFIPYSTAGVAVERNSLDGFEKIYKKSDPTYPIARAATLLVGYAMQFGGTLEALNDLGALINITKEQEEMAAARLARNNAPKSTTTKIVKNKDGGREVTGSRKVRDSAAALFRGLIMEGGKSDDQIFAKVAKTFDLDEDSHSRVAWYRWQLRKEGKNPPGAVRADGSSARGRPPTKTSKVTKKVAKKVAKKKVAKKKVAKKKVAKKKVAKKKVGL